MKKNLKKILEIVFSKVTSEATEFIDWYGYKTTEVVFGKLQKNFGIGIKDDHSAIKLFYIDGRYNNSDCKRFKQTFRIGDGEYWVINLAQDQLIVDIGNFSFLSNHMEAVNEIMLLIKETEKL